MSKKLLLIFLAALLGAIVGAGLVAYFFIKIAPVASQEKTKELSGQDRIKDFYLTENAVHVSPHSLRGKMDKGDTSFVLVDLRSPQEYEKEHIIGAISIPAYKDPATSAYGDVDRIVGAFEKLPKDKEIVVYCYSHACMTGRKIGKMLVEHNIFVKHLDIGWNEWRYFWNLWNHDGEKPSKVEDYISSGTEPGTPKLTELGGTCTKGEFGC